MALTRRKKNAQRKLYYQKNREKLLEKSRKRREIERARKGDTVRKYRRRNTEAIRQQNVAQDRGNNMIHDYEQLLPSVATPPLLMPDLMFTPQNNAYHVINRIEHRHGSQPSSSLKVTPPPPTLPLPEFMRVLEMQPVTNDAVDADDDGSRGGGDGGGSSGAVDRVCVVGKEKGIAGTSKRELSAGPGPKETLVDKFKADPDGVMKLLQSSTSMEKLSGLLKEPHKADSGLLSELQSRFEGAYHTLRQCEESKLELYVRIDNINQKIGEKRKHLEALRAELKILGNEELKLKQHRAMSQIKCSELMKKLQCSAKALEQITQLRKANQGNTSSRHQQVLNI